MFTATNRRPEIGIRAAIGARPSDLLRWLLARGLGPVATGIALGCALGAAAGLVMASLLFGVGPFDTTTYVVVLVGIGSAATLAVLGPSLSALRHDLVELLRAI